LRDTALPVKGIHRTEPISRRIADEELAGPAAPRDAERRVAFPRPASSSSTTAFIFVVEDERAIDHEPAHLEEQIGLHLELQRAMQLDPFRRELFSIL